MKFYKIGTRLIAIGEAGYFIEINKGITTTRLTYGTNFLFVDECLKIGKQIPQEEFLEVADPIILNMASEMTKKLFK